MVVDHICHRCANLANNNSPDFHKIIKIRLLFAKWQQFQAFCFLGTFGSDPKYCDPLLPKLNTDLAGNMHFAM